MRSRSRTSALQASKSPAVGQRGVERADAVGGIVALEVKGIGDVLASLEQRLAAGEVARPLFGLARVATTYWRGRNECRLPACEAGPEMVADQRLMGAGVNDKAINAAAENEIAAPSSRTDGCSILFRWAGSERLCADDIPAGRASRRYAVEGNLLALRFGRQPELDHRMIGPRADLQALKRSAVRFRRELDAIVVAPFCELAVMVVGIEIADGAAEIPEKLLGGREIASDAAGDRGRYFSGRSRAGHGILRELRRPVLPTGFVAVHVVIGHRLFRQFGAELAQHGCDALVVVEIGSFAAEFVALQPVTAERAGAM